MTLIKPQAFEQKIYRLLLLPRSTFGLCEIVTQPRDKGTIHDMDSNQENK